MGLIERAAVPCEEPGLASVDLVISLVELLAGSKRSHAMSDIARQMGISKARTHRHLRALMQHGYVLQDRTTERYEIGTKLLALGEAVRDRFDVLGRDANGNGQAAGRDGTDGYRIDVDRKCGRRPRAAARQDGRGVRRSSGFDARLSRLGARSGRPRIRTFASGRAGSRASAESLDAIDTDEFRQAQEADRQSPQSTLGDGGRSVSRRRQHARRAYFRLRDAWRGTIAIVGSTQFIAAKPSKEQLRQVSAAAAEASRRLGWRTP